MIAARRVQAHGSIYTGLGSQGEHWHHDCWCCGQDICGFAKTDYYTCSDCKVEERKCFSNEQCDRSFDPLFAATHASPA